MGTHTIRSIIGILGVLWRNPFALIAVTAFLLGAGEARHVAPMDAVFSGSLSWIQFFEIPIARFYLFLALAWVEVLRRTGILPYLFFFLTLGVIASCTAKDAAAPHSPAAGRVLIAGELLLFAIALSRTGSGTSPFSALTALIFPILYAVVRVFEAKGRVPAESAHDA
ncbi:MAG: hypothetical protein AAB533_04035 [Patescibacteria group bacterium]